MIRSRVATLFGAALLVLAHMPHSMADADPSKSPKAQTVEQMPPDDLRSSSIALSIIGIACEAAKGAYVGRDTRNNPVFYVICKAGDDYLMAIDPGKALYLAQCSRDLDTREMCQRASVAAGY